MVAAVAAGCHRLAVPSDGTQCKLISGIDYHPSFCVIDAVTAALTARYPWPSWVKFLTGDAIEVSRSVGSFDLIFTDAQDGGNREGWTRRLPPFDPAATCSL